MMSRLQDLKTTRQLHPTNGRKTLCSVAVLCLMVLCAGFAGRAAAEPVPELEARFLQLTQALRVQPAATLAALFPEARFPLQEQPFFQSLAAQGMPRLVPNEVLSRSAAATAEALMAQAESGTGFAEPPPLGDRLAQHGYPAIEKGEIITGLTFRNFVQPEVAADALFRQVLVRELSTANLRDMVLLNPHVRDIGLSCRTGRITADGVTQNAYVLVVHSGAHILHYLELHLFQELNRWRQDPGRGLFPVLLSAATGSPGPFPLDPVPVFLWDPKLYEEARALGSPGSVSAGLIARPNEEELRGRDVLYPPLQGSIPLDASMGIDQVTALLWQSLLQREAERWALHAGPYALQPSASRAALFLFLGTSEDGNAFLEATLVVATPSADLTLGSRLAGLVRELDGTPERGPVIQEARVVSAATGEIKASSIVDSAGGFSLGTASPLYPPFTPYELLFLAPDGREVFRQELPLGLDGAFVEVVKSGG